MHPVPAKPNFVRIDFDALLGIDWTDQRVVGPVLKQLQRDVESNSELRTGYMNDALLAAKTRIREMQASAEFGKKTAKDTTLVNTDDTLKRARDEVKRMMNESTEVERDYFAAMQSFREKGNLDFAGKFASYLKDFRTKVQDADKKTSAVPGQVKALEGFSSGLIKQIREHRGAISDNLQRLEKLKSAAEKAKTMAADANTNLDKINSSITSMERYVTQLPATEKSLKGLAIDLEARNAKFFASMGAIETLTKAMKTLAKGFDGHGFTDLVKPHVKAVDELFDKLIKDRDAVIKNLTSLRKDKKLPDEIRKLLPEKL